MHVEQRGATELQRRNRELEVLNAIAESLNASADLHASLTATLSRVAEFFGLDTGWVWLLDEDTNEPYLAATQNLPPALTEDPTQMEGRCYCLETFQGGDLTGAANVNVVTCSRLKWLSEGTAGLRYHASVPLYAHHRKLGVLNVASPEWRSLSAAELRLLHTIGDMLGIAIERARLYARSAAAGAAEERNRLAREIHDTLAQSLAAIALRLDTMDALLESGATRERVSPLLEEALSITRRSLEETRRTVLDLRAAPLEGRTLAEALADLADASAHAREADVHVDTVGGAHPLPAQLEVGLYRVAQEALANSLRHADARRIDIRLVIEPARVTLLVDDDGRGFDPSIVGEGRFGLTGMNERARLLGGSLRVHSTAGAGTRVEVVVPLTNA